MLKVAATHVKRSCSAFTIPLRCAQRFRPLNPACERNPRAGDAENDKKVSGVLTDLLASVIFA